MKLAICKQRIVLLDSMASGAIPTLLIRKDRKSADGRGAHGLFVAAELIAVERRITANQRALETCDSHLGLADGHRAWTERRGEFAAIPRIAIKFNNACLVRLIHLDGIRNVSAVLIFEIGLAAIPKLREVIRRVENSGRVA